MRFALDGVGEGILVAERVSRGWALYLRLGGNRKIYVKKLTAEQACVIVEGPLDVARNLAYDMVLDKYGSRAELLGYTDRGMLKPWTKSLGVWVDVGKIYWDGEREKCWRRQGILVIKRKRGNQWAYYLMEKPEEWWRLLEHMPRRKAKTFRKCYYLTSVPKEHLELIFDGPLHGRIPKEKLKAIFNYFMTRLISVMEWRYVEPHRFKPKISYRPSREDEGVIGELQSKAEDYGWGEVEEELMEDGDWETIDELRDEGYLDGGEE
ncbi:MAG: hypothetical protein ACPLOC_09040 [Candidatus Bathyarchaeales archaeon]